MLLRWYLVILIPWYYQGRVPQKKKRQPFFFCAPIPKHLPCYNFLLKHIVKQCNLWQLWSFLVFLTRLKHKPYIKVVSCYLFSFRQIIIMTPETRMRLMNGSYAKVSSRLLGLIPVANSNQPRTVAYSYMSRSAVSISISISISIIRI